MRYSISRKRGQAKKITEFNCNLQLKRLDAKVEFIVKNEVPAEKIGIWKNFDFRPKRLAGGERARSVVGTSQDGWRYRR